MASGPDSEQIFDYLLILDFEATCNQGGRQPRPQEIIEFPCMKMCTKTWQVESVFHRYVRPKAHPKLTDFCTELTGIVQVNFRLCLPHGCLIEDISGIGRRSVAY